MFLVLFCSSKVLTPFRYADTVYNKPNEKWFKANLENVQYKACVTFISAI